LKVRYYDQINVNIVIEIYCIGSNAGKVLSHSSRVERACSAHMHRGNAKKRTIPGTEIDARHQTPWERADRFSVMLNDNRHAVSRQNGSARSVGAATGRSPRVLRAQLLQRYDISHHLALVAAGLWAEELLCALVFECPAS
jgi:hypothetical protein